VAVAMMVSQQKRVASSRSLNAAVVYMTRMRTKQSRRMLMFITGVVDAMVGVLAR
jgi:FtsZ-interacting cell division protein YlmF